MATRIQNGIPKWSLPKSPWPIVKETLNKQQLLTIVNNEEKVKHWLQNKTIINTICVPNKIVNFVVK